MLLSPSCKISSFSLPGVRSNRYTCIFYLYIGGMKTSNNFQNALPASFELLDIISTDFFRFFSKVKTKSGTFPEMNKTVLYPLFMKKITCLHISGATSVTT